MKPTQQQQDILDYVQNETGNVVIIARAGTGKTSILVEIIKALPPYLRVLCLAFNKRICVELEKRIPAHAKARTFHSLGRLTLGAYPKFRTFKHDDDKDWCVAEKALEGSRFNDSDDGRKLRDDCIDRIRTAASLVKANNILTRADLLQLIADHELDTSEIEAAELAGLVAGAVKLALDDWPHTSFDDEVWLPVHYGLGLGSFDVVLVDELQDLSVNQYELARSAMAPGARLIGVGDPAQGIYSWRGADSGIIPRIISAFDARTFPLSVSFRCPKKVVEFAKQYVPDFEAAPGAPAGSVQNIDLSRMFALAKVGDFVLSRLNAPLAQVCFEFVRLKTPARVVGQDIRRALEGLIKKSKAQTVETLLAWLAHYEEKEVGRMRAKKREKSVDYVRDKVQTLREVCDEATTIADVCNAIGKLFVEDRQRYVICSSVHRCKGDETNNVFLLEETFFLKRGDPQEEANIHYVASTRAARNLYLVSGLYNRDRDDGPAQD